jgi:hypothetical protein
MILLRSTEAQEDFMIGSPPPHSADRVALAQLPEAPNCALA